MASAVFPVLIPGLLWGSWLLFFAIFAMGRKRSRNAGPAIEGKHKPLA
jgi:hypothetical protein